MYETADGFFSVDTEGIMRMCLNSPRECSCHRMVMFVINRDGKTRCIECDRKYQELGKDF